MFINFWYPALKGEDLKDEPVHVRMLGQDFVLFRDQSGKAHCLSNVCVHRGGSLAHGKRKGDCVECPYHGWQFNGDGQCTRVPSMGPNAKIPARAKVDSYPVEEKYGLVLAFLGDLPEEQRPYIMKIPEYGEEGWRATIQHWVFNIDYKRSIENGIDGGHNEFVHPTHSYSGARTPEEIRVGERKIFETEWGRGTWGQSIRPPLPDRKMRAASGRDKDGVIEGGTGHHGANCVWTYIHPSAHMFIRQYLFEAPVDESHTSVYLVNLRNFLIEPEQDARMMERNQYVVNQDRDVLLPLRPVITPRTNTKETLIEDDESIALYREKIKQWEAMGWRIDIDKLSEANKRVAYAIPSPARRQSKGWALDPVPLLPKQGVSERVPKVAAE